MHAARRAKNDEFYTRIEDISKELKHYREHFKGKTVFLNCDDPQKSNFWKYFASNFEFLGLKRLISTHYEEDQPSYKLELFGDENGDGKINDLDTIKTPLKQNGDFRSPESVELLKEADIVVTNPPFSLFREYISLLMKHNKKFLVVGNLNAVTYKEIFPLIRDNEVWLGASPTSGMKYQVPLDAEKWDFIDEDGNKFASGPPSAWYTNLTHSKRNEEIILFQEYNEEEYPTYTNFEAIEVSRVKNIPMDYDGVMGVPISFLPKYNPNQFEILDLNPHFFSVVSQGFPKPKQLKLEGKKDPYARILIRRKN